MSLLVCQHCQSKMHAHGTEDAGHGAIKRRWRCTNPDCRKWRTAYSRDGGATWRFENQPRGRKPLNLVFA